jgi:hypothetical protein
MLSFTLTFGWGNRALDIVEFEKADHLSGNLGSGFAVASENGKFLLGQSVAERPEADDGTHS